jgi:hypothetical protein
MRIISSLILLTILFSCGNVKRLDTAEIKNQMDNYKIKKVSPAQIMSQLNTLGNELRTKVVAIEANTCLEAKQKVDSLAKAYDADIQLIDIESIDIVSIANAKEKLLYEAYKYDFEKAQVAATNSQQISEETYLFTFGLAANSPILICENMHPHYQYFWKITWSKTSLVRSF